MEHSHNGNYCRSCGKFCFDETYCEVCKEHIGTCDTCGEYFDMRDLQDVFKHEHKGIDLTNTGYIKQGKRVKEATDDK